MNLLELAMLIILSTGAEYKKVLPSPSPHGSGLSACTDIPDELRNSQSGEGICVEAVKEFYYPDTTKYYVRIFDFMGNTINVSNKEKDFIKISSSISKKLVEAEENRKLERERKFKEYLKKIEKSLRSQK